MNTPPGKSFGFGISGLRKYPELIPIVFVTGVAVVGCASYCAYCLMTKTDFRFLRGNGNIKTEWEAIKPTERRKLIIVNPDVYKPIKEVEAIKREIGSFKR